MRKPFSAPAEGGFFAFGVRWLDSAFKATSSRRTPERCKLYEHILMRRGDNNVSFESLCTLLEKLGFDRRVRGDHHIFWMGGVEEILNLQPSGLKAKAYQVKQVRAVILKYKLNLGE